ncbi:MAG: AAA family ATPase [Phycisphaerales bacterium]|nr:AAA family ATPase [Phycisphaerales bacterium]
MTVEQDVIASKIDALRSAMGTVLVGQQALVDHLLLALLADGHVLVEGVPGLAKTLSISTLANCLDLSFARVQFTPDLMPSDLTGTEIIQEDRSSGSREMRFVQGPVFTNILLADEINRTPPRTQAALLEAMQERQVSASGVRRPLTPPFFVLATQNPIEQQGTYPLPEAQLDRFLISIRVEYPSESQECEIVKRTTESPVESPSPVMSAEDVLQLQKVVRSISVPDHITARAVAIVRATRPDDVRATDLVRRCVSWGAGPRASQAIILVSKARALLEGRSHVNTDDLDSVIHAVLRHRVLLNFTAQSESVSMATILNDIQTQVTQESIIDAGMAPNGIVS